jgi:hypothetical protein
MNTPAATPPTTTTTANSAVSSPDGNNTGNSVSNLKWKALFLPPELCNSDMRAMNSSGTSNNNNGGEQQRPLTDGAALKVDTKVLLNTNY